MIADNNKFFETLFNANPTMTFVVDSDVVIKQCNKAAEEFTNDERNKLINKRGGEAFNCIHHTDVPEGCGHGSECKNCVLRNSVNQSFAGNSVHRKITTMTFVKDGVSSEKSILITTVPFEHDNEKLSLLFLEDVSELIQLRNLLPICAWCKKIRNDTNYWVSVENYLSSHLDVSFSHGICPDCAEKQFPEAFKRIGDSKTQHN